MVRRNSFVSNEVVSETFFLSSCNSDSPSLPIPTSRSEKKSRQIKKARQTPGTKERRGEGEEEEENKVSLRTYMLEWLLLLLLAILPGGDIHRIYIRTKIARLDTGEL